eukprot:COSAG06_NODE_7086_length_2639_cov_121.892520_2_plen_63_part_00
MIRTHMVECPQRSLALAAHKTAAQPSRCFETMIIILRLSDWAPTPQMSDNLLFCLMSLATDS